MGIELEPHLPATDRYVVLPRPIMSTHIEVVSVRMAGRAVGAGLYN